MSRLDGGVPCESGTSQEIALAALTRRVAELEHRLNMMKIIIGLVLAAKVLVVALFIYILFGNVLVARGGNSSPGSVRGTMIMKQPPSDLVHPAAAGSA